MYKIFIVNQLSINCRRAIFQYKQIVEIFRPEQMMKHHFDSAKLLIVIILKIRQI